VGPEQPPPQPGPPQYAPPPAGYPPPQFGAPQPGYQYPVVVAQSKTNGFAIASLVLGILWIWWIGSILALVFGYIAKGRIDRSNGYETGRGMAIAGIVLGWIGVATLTLLIILGAIGAFNDPY